MQWRVQLSTSSLVPRSLIRSSYKYHVKSLNMFPEIPDIFSKYLSFSPKYLEKILNIPSIFLSFFCKYHNNDFVKSNNIYCAFSTWSSSRNRFRFSRNQNLRTFSICHFVQGWKYLVLTRLMGYNIHEENQ